MKFSTATIFLLTSLTVAVPLYPYTAPPVKSVDSIHELNVGRSIVSDANANANDAGNDNSPNGDINL
ncbi:uncharacterized protein BKCO1_2000310 [Diplodia corticola]|uniref:Uncharacterized protein n=1 Tax=Diplodia corticola TaxID=236234 RepID=A0A1J9SJK1_9PEZI|nr:uncharacterized protein BKCO1_2000310 [Diplodia corticola]OJD39932.1 hypothetical protein BKCO1_2000310 [Diplodia corticola]